MKKLQYKRIVGKTLATAIMAALMLWYAPGELLMSKAGLPDNDISFVVATEEMNATGVVNNDKLNVRSGPSTSDDVIGQLTDGDTVDITGMDGDWYRIEYDEEVGYVASKYIELKDKDAESDEGSDDAEDASSDEEDNEEGDNKSVLSGTDITTTAIVAAVILLLVIIIFATIKSIRNLSDDDDEDYYEDDYYEEDDYEEDDEEDDDEDYEEDEDDEDEEDDYYEDDYVEEPIRRPEPKVDSYKDVPPALKAVRDGADPAKYMSDNPEDYRIDIDPSYFEKTATLPDLNEVLEDDEDAPKPIGPAPESEASLDDSIDDKEVRIEEALKKMEELKAEIESIKNS